MSRDEARTRTKGETLVDAVRQSAVDRYQLRTRRRIVLFIVLVIVAWVVVSIVRRFTEDRPVDYASAAEHFKYGSIGSEPGGSLLNAVGGVLPPYEIFKVLPAVCPDLLPGGYPSLGFIFEPGKDLPIGVSKRRRLGVDQVGLNCASCHAGTVRADPAAPPQIVLGMGAHTLDIQRLTKFMLDCTLSERFTPDVVVHEIEKNTGKLGFFDRLLYRRALVPRTKEATLQLVGRLTLILGDEVTPWGRGRVDTFNPYKAIQFNWLLSELPLDELNGASDFPSLWNQEPREGMHLHWDGNNDSVDERNLSAALGAGVTPVTIDHERLRRVADWAWTLPPPPYPWPQHIDRTLAGQGEPLYETYCASCHSFSGEYVGTVVPLEEVGTDAYRLHSYTSMFASNQYTLYPSSEYRFTHFRKTNGYANHPLDGIWARAPYLHNGSVPTLRDLLELPENRPTSFFRGYDVYDQDRVGFVSDVSVANGLEFTYYDTSLKGNGNGGHTWGTELSEAQKAAIVEYMKTL